MSSAFPYAIEPLEEKENDAIKKDFTGYLSGAVRVQPRGYFFQGIYRHYAHQYFNLPLKPTDVFVASYPKSGTTWTQELVWLLMHNLDYEGAKESLDDRFPFVEADHVLDPEVFQRPEIKAKLKAVPKPGDRLAQVLKLEEPRCIKTHMPFSLLPPKILDTCKVIYVARDPRDVVVSYYHHHRMWITHGFQGDFKAFFDYFLKEQVMWSPFWEHLREAWERRSHSNLLILTYDQLKEDLPAVIRKVAGFLGKEVSQEEANKLANHLHFDSMKNNPAVNAVADASTGLLDLKEGGFVRKGKSGGWKSYFDDDMKEKFHTWMLEKGGNLAKEFKWMK